MKLKRTGSPFSISYWRSFTAKIDEFARQKYGVTLSGDPFFNLFSQRLSAGHD
jgi:hypothetical protein